MAATLGAIPRDGRRIVCCTSSRRNRARVQAHAEIGEGRPDARSLQRLPVERCVAGDPRFGERDLHRQQRRVHPGQHGDLRRAAPRPPTHCSIAVQRRLREFLAPRLHHGATALRPTDAVSKSATVVAAVVRRPDRLGDPVHVVGENRGGRGRPRLVGTGS